MNQHNVLPFLQNGVAQVGLIVEDLDQTVEAYWRSFGIGPWHIYTYGRPLVKRMTYRGQSCEYRMRIALSYLGPLRIELIEMLEGETIYDEFVRDHGYGLHHFGVLVEDMEAAVAQARDAGLTVIQDGAGFGLDGDGHYAYLDTEDKIGVTIELIQRPKRRAPPERIYPPPEGDAWRTSKVHRTGHGPGPCQEDTATCRVRKGIDRSTTARWRGSHDYPDRTMGDLRRHAGRP